MKKRLIAVPLSQQDFAALSQNPSASSFNPPIPQVPQQLAQQPVRHVPRRLDGSDWFRVVSYGVMIGWLPIPLGMLIYSITHDNNITGELFLLFVCIVSWIISFITTKKIGLKWAGVISGFVAVMTCEILIIIISVLPSSSRINDIGGLFLFFLILALIDMFPAFIAAWLATVLQARWIIVCIALLFMLVGGILLYSPVKAYLYSLGDPYPSYLPSNGTIALDDPLHDNSKGYNWEWDQSPDKYGGICEFTGESYRVNVPDPSSAELCPAQNTNFSNFAFEVQMTIIKGDTGGLMFRAAPPNGNIEEEYYHFWVTQDGYYGLEVCSRDTCTTLIKTSTSSYINTGLNQTNLIAVVANGSAISLYVNQQLLSTVNDSTYSQGQIGLVAYPYYKTGQPTEVIYTNAKVWTLS